MLQAGLGDSNRDVRNTAAAAVAAIAKHDYPERWPSLLNDLIIAISIEGNHCLGNGAVTCLSLMADHLSIEESYSVRLRSIETVHTYMNDSTIYLNSAI